MLTDRWDNFDSVTARFYGDGARVSLQHAFFCGAYGFSVELQNEFSKCKSVEEFQACWQRLLSEINGYFEEMRKQSRPPDEHSNDLQPPA